MKKIKLINCILILSAIIVSCTLEEEILPVENLPVNAQIQNNNSTKVNLNNGSLSWNMNDEISLFDANTGNKKYKFAGDNNSKDGQFTYVSGTNTTESLDALYAIYPYSATNKIATSGKINLSLAQTQYMNPSDVRFNSLMVAKSQGPQDRNLNFKNAYGYLNFKLLGTDEITEIRVYDRDGKKISGNAEIELNEKNEPILKVLGTADYTTKYAVLEMTKAAKLNTSKATDFYLALPPNIYGQLSITFEDKNGNSMYRSFYKDITIKRNVISPLEPLYYVPSDVNSDFTKLSDVGYYIAEESGNFRKVCEFKDNILQVTDITSYSDNTRLCTIIDPINRKYIRFNSLTQKIFEGKVCKDVKISSLGIEELSDCTHDFVMLKWDYLTHKLWLKSLDSKHCFIIKTY